MSHDVFEDVSVNHSRLPEQTNASVEQTRANRTAFDWGHTLSSSMASLEPQIGEITDLLSDELHETSEAAGVAEAIRKTVSDVLDVAHTQASATFDAVSSLMQRMNEGPNSTSVEDIRVALADAVDAVARQSAVLPQQVQEELAAAVADLGRAADEDAKVGEAATRVQARVEEVVGTLRRDFDTTVRRAYEVIAAARKDPRVQFVAGVVAGGVAGAAPGGFLIAPIAEVTALDQKVPPDFRAGYGLGETAAGVAQMATGAGAASGGVALDLTVVGAVAGVPVSAAGVVAVAEGAADVAAGAAVFQKAMAELANQSQPQLAKIGDDLDAFSTDEFAERLRSDKLHQFEDLRVNIDERAAVNEDLLDVEERMRRALDVDKRQFLESMTNQGTKNNLVERNLPSPPRLSQPVSVTTDPSAILIRTWDEIVEMRAIAGKAREAGLRAQARGGDPTAVKNAINKAVIRAIKRGSKEHGTDAANVNTALRKALNRTDNEFFTRPPSERLPKR